MNLHQILCKAQWCSSADTIEMIQMAFWDNAMNAAQTEVWNKDGWESVESGLHSGKPATSKTPENVERVRAAMNKDQPLTAQELEADLGILKTTVFEILMQDLGMKRVVAEFVPQLLLPEQKGHQATVANDLIKTSNNEPDFLKKVIMEMNTGSMAMILETKAQLSQWDAPGSPFLKKV